MISVDDALGIILDHLDPVGVEVVSLAESLDRLLAVDLEARRSQPEIAVSSMDGYAVRAADLSDGPTRLDCVATIPAGSAETPTIPPGACARIFTGAAVPPGADTVVIQENTTIDDQGGVWVTEPIKAPGQWIRPAGLDFTKGDIVLSMGTRLGPAEIGLAAAMNHPWLTVRRRPRVAILATGDEVALPGDPVSTAALPSSNSFQLMALVRRAGGEPVHCGIVSDDADLLHERVVEAASSADLVITSGGASVGDHDHVQRLFGRPDGMPPNGPATKRHFWKIAMRPGKPLIFGTIAGTPLLGLPGNPVSCFVCGLVFMVPAIRRLTGHAIDSIVTGMQSDVFHVKVARELSANDHRQDYLRASLRKDDSGEWWVEPFEKQDSSMMSILARANALIIRPPNAERVPLGDFVSVIKL